MVNWIISAQRYLSFKQIVLHVIFQFRCNTTQDQDSKGNDVLVLLVLQVVVLWVGTNNHGHTPEQICKGILAIIQVIKNKLPNAQTLVLVRFLRYIP